MQPTDPIREVGRQLVGTFGDWPLAREKVRELAPQLDVDTLGAALEQTLLELFLPHAYRWASALGVAATQLAHSDFPVDYAYLRLTEGGLDSFLNERPALRRALGRASDNWWRDVSTSLRHFAELTQHDCAVLGLTHRGEVESIELGVSDRHFGRSAARIWTTTGGQLIYKPRSAEVDDAWEDFLRWCCKQRPDWDLRWAPTIDMGTHSWARIVLRVDVDRGELMHYYVNAGRLLMVLQLLRATDMHLENVVAARVPVPIDLECLMHPIIPTGRGEPSSARLETIFLFQRSSVLTCGLLPSWLPTAATEGAPFGALNPMEINRYERVRFGIDSDGQFRKLTTIVAITALQHVPSTTAGDVTFEDVEAVCSGYTDAYRFFMTRSKLADPAAVPLARFESIVVRVLLRSTGEYESILDQVRSRLSDKGQPSVRALVDKVLTPSLLPTLWAQTVREAELDQLALLDIPIFGAVASKRDLLVDGLCVVQDAFATSPLQDARTFLASLSESDMDRQVELVRASYDQVASARYEGRELTRGPTEPHFEDPPRRPPASFDAVKYANRTVERLLDRLVPDRGDYQGLMVVPAGTARRVRFSPLGTDLYSGTLGLAVLCAALYRLTGASSCLRAIEKVVQPALQPLERSTAGPQQRLGLTGFGGDVYALSVIGRFLEDNEYVVAASGLLGRVELDPKDPDLRLDLLDGVAGLLAGLSFLAGDGDPIAIELGDKCALVLREAQVVGPHGDGHWPDRTGSSYTGMAHGSAGIALALARASTWASDTQLIYQSICRSCQFEDSQVDQLALNWHIDDRRDKGPLLSQWCHGSLGICLSRGVAAELVTGHLSGLDLDQYCRAAIDFNRSPWDSLCCGDAGRVELELLSSGVEKARHRALGIGQRAESLGRHQWLAGDDILNPGFFTGATGVAFQVLRAFFPSDVSLSVATLE